MSHFSILVVGTDVEAALQPFHEFECTGTDDQYIEEINETEDYRAQYAEATVTKIKAPDGSLHERFTAQGDYDPRWWKPVPKNPGDIFASDRKELSLPEGYEQVELPAKDHSTFLQWVRHETSSPVLTLQDKKTEEHKYGYIVAHNGEVTHVIRRTNPNKKWDWWTEGGRWSNKLLLKSGARADSAKVSEVDWLGMQKDYREKAAAAFNRVMEVIAGRAVVTWEQTRTRREAGEFDIDGARDFYHGQPVVRDLLDSEALDRWDGAETLSNMLASPSCEAYAHRMGQLNASTWAMLFNGEWSERGEMGWFGMANDTDASTADYVTKFWNVLKGLPDDTQITVVDCHI